MFTNLASRITSKSVANWIDKANQEEKYPSSKFIPRSSEAVAEMIDQVSKFYDLGPKFDGFTDDILKQLKTMSESLARKKGSEEVLSKVFLLLANAAFQDKENVLEEVLKTIGEYLKVIRCRVCLFDEIKDRMLIVATWIEDLSDPTKLAIENQSVSELKWLKDKLANNEIVQIENIENLPKEANKEYKFWSSVGIKSIVVFPIKCGGEWSGGITCGSDKISKWYDDDIKILSILGQAVICAVARKIGCKNCGMCPFDRTFTISKFINQTELNRV